MHVVLYSSVSSKFGKTDFILGMFANFHSFRTVVNSILWLNYSVALTSTVTWRPFCFFTDGSKLRLHSGNLECTSSTSRNILLPLFTYLQLRNVFSMLLIVFWLGCSAPPNVFNAQILITLSQWPIGTQIPYTCNVGHTLQGQGTITCLSNGQWTAVPACIFDSQPQVCKFHISFD